MITQNLISHRGFYTSLTAFVTLAIQPTAQPAALASDPIPVRREQREAAARQSVEIIGRTDSSQRQTLAVNGKPSLPAVSVEQGPQVDGRLDDDVWRLAPIGGPLLQYEPDEGAPMTELTEFRIVYDQTHLYLGFWCYDSKPQLIRRRIMERDGPIFSDDYIWVTLDTFHDQRNGYVFAVNALGARWDALVNNNVNRNSNWDGVWEAKTSVNESGWQLEMAIPFKSLSFDPNGHTWGLNVSRSINRKFERGRWTAAHPGTSTQYVSEAGDITGLKGLNQGLGLEISPYLLGRFTDEDRRDDKDLSGEFGTDVRYRFTPNLAGALSYNMDFAETEVDQRQINFSRFPLFFPEKRGFFLEDSGVFEFGALGTSSRNSLLGRNLIPFFSRRIGRSATGEVVPITFAGKLTGRVGKYHLGFLNAALDNHQNLGAQNAFAGRISRDVWEQSSVGLITTIGDPASTGGNVVAGPDFLYRTTSFRGNKTLEASVFSLVSHSAEADNENGYAYGVGLAYPNDRIRASVQMMEIDDHFDPALGFVRRRGTRAYASSWRYRTRPEIMPWMREWNVLYSNRFYTDLDQQLDSSEHDLTPVWIELDSGDDFWLGVERSFDSPDEAFSLGNTVMVPAGDYHWTTYRAGLDLASKRMISGDVGLSIGDFYDGRRQRVSYEVDLLPWKHLGLSFEYSFNHIVLPRGTFDTQVTAVRMLWNFTPDLVWSHLFQYDTLSDTIGLNSRLQWEYRPGTKLYLVLNNSSSDVSPLIFQVYESDITLKLGATFRF